MSMCIFPYIALISCALLWKRKEIDNFMCRLEIEFNKRQKVHCQAIPSHVWGTIHPTCHKLLKLEQQQNCTRINDFHFIFSLWIKLICFHKSWTHSRVWDEFSYPFPKHQWCSCWSLGMDKKLHPTLYNRCNYLSMLGLKSTMLVKDVPEHLQLQVWHCRYQIQGSFCVCAQPMGDGITV